jgi:hypothetical protein
MTIKLANSILGSNWGGGGGGGNLPVAWVGPPCIREWTSIPPVEKTQEKATTSLNIFSQKSVQRDR